LLSGVGLSMLLTAQGAMPSIGRVSLASVAIFGL
jgi:hypothetical protein